MIQINDEYRAVAKEYKKTFGYGVPLSMIPPTAEMSDLVANIKTCIEDKEDRLLDMMGVKIDEGNLF